MEGKSTRSCCSSPRRREGIIRSTNDVTGDGRLKKMKEGSISSPSRTDSKRKEHSLSPGKSSRRSHKNATSGSSRTPKSTRSKKKTLTKSEKDKFASLSIALNLVDLQGLDGDDCNSSDDETRVTAYDDITTYLNSTKDNKGSERQEITATTTTTAEDGNQKQQGSKSSSSSSPVRRRHRRRREEERKEPRNKRNSQKEPEIDTHKPRVDGNRSPRTLRSEAEAEAEARECENERDTGTTADPSESAGKKKKKSQQVLVIIVEKKVQPTRTMMMMIMQ